MSIVGSIKRSELVSMNDSDFEEIVSNRNLITLSGPVYNRTETKIDINELRKQRFEHRRSMIEKATDTTFEKMIDGIDEITNLEELLGKYDLWIRTFDINEISNAKYIEKENFNLCKGFKIHFK